jgi:transglutaminase-like putative cysteine protease
MTISVGLSAAFVIFWGWQTNWLLLSIGLALLLESSRFIRVRWEFSDLDIYRVSVLSSCMLVALFLFRLLAGDLESASIDILKWLPLIFSPLLLAQKYGTTGKISYHSIFLFWRDRPGRSKKPRYIDLAPFYFALCLLSASIANVRTAGFYLGLVALCLWLLWINRSRHYHPLLTGVCLILAISLGYAGQVGLAQLQGQVEESVSQWYSGWLRNDFDPNQSETALGQLGELKLSDRILFRVASPAGSLLLREGSYPLYRSGRWLADPPDLSPIRAEADETTWHLAELPGPEQKITVFDFLRKNSASLKLPNGTALVSNLPVFGMKRNLFGAVLVSGGPGLLSYDVHYHEHVSADQPPRPSDLNLPKKLAPTLHQITEKLGIQEISPTERVQRLQEFFSQNFSYSLVQKKACAAPDALEYFLLTSHQGHCEFFASATVLLLRAAGIPARYAIGYAVDEYSPWEKRYIVRQRHAHAWTLVYLDGHWQDLDTTPAIWREAESSPLVLFQKISDLGNWLRFAFSQWRWREGHGMPDSHWFFMVIMVILISYMAFLWRKYRPARAARSRSDSPPEPAWPGGDSEFYRIEKMTLFTQHS